MGRSKPGGSTRLPNLPMRNWQSPARPTEQEFSSLKIDGQAFSSGKGDYGYLVPIRFHGKPEADGANVLRIALPATAEGAEPVQIARVEIDYGG